MISSILFWFPYQLCLVVNHKSVIPNRLGFAWTSADLLLLTISVHTICELVRLFNIFFGKVLWWWRHLVERALLVSNVGELPEHLDLALWRNYGFETEQFTACHKRISRFICEASFKLILVCYFVSMRQPCFRTNIAHPAIPIEHNDVMLVCVLLSLNGPFVFIRPAWFIYSWHYSWSVGPRVSLLFKRGESMSHQMIKTHRYNRPQIYWPLNRKINSRCNC